MELETFIVFPAHSIVVLRVLRDCLVRHRLVEKDRVRIVLMPVIPCPCDTLHVVVVAGAARERFGAPHGQIYYDGEYYNFVTPPRPKRPKRFSELTQYGLLHSTVYVTLQCQPHTKTHPAHTFRLDSGNGSDRGGMFEVAKVRLGRPVEVQCGFGNPPPLSAKRRPMKHRPNSADRFDRNRRNGRNVFGAVCFARTGVSGRSVSVRRTS